MGKCGGLISEIKLKEWYGLVRNKKSMWSTLSYVMGADDQIRSKENMVSPWTTRDDKRSQLSSEEITMQLKDSLEQLIRNWSRMMDTCWRTIYRVPLPMEQS